MKTILELAQGNPGALMFLMKLAQAENPGRDFGIAVMLEELPTVRGTNLYVLWSDLCGNDLDQVYSLLQKCPPDILEDACSRQDYSGRELIQSYMI